MVSDYLIFSAVPSAISFAGASLVIFGFFLVVWQRSDENREVQLLTRPEIDEQIKVLLSNSDHSDYDNFVEDNNNEAKPEFK
jgi:hypothetical protein